MDKKDVLGIVKDKRVQWVAVGIVLFVVLFMSSSIRLSNLDLLKDQTTGEYIPLALDPFYFLRLSETIVEQGSLPEFDVMRNPGLDVPFSYEILPQATVCLWNLFNIFGEHSLRYVNVVSPVVYFILGILIFFGLIYFLTKSKLTATISIVFLSFIPAYLYRTMAGFSDHEAIGMVAFFAALFICAISFKGLEKNKEFKMSLFGAVLGFLTVLTVVSWGGIANFLFMIIPLGFFIWWLMRGSKRNYLSGLKFYICWVIFSLVSTVFFRVSFERILKGYFLSSYGMISLFVLMFVLVDYILVKWNIGKNILEKWPREIKGLLITSILGVIGLTAIGKNIFSLLSEVWLRIFHPWGTERIGLTVAENAQPYLLDWISASGSILFWMFFAGMITIGYEISKGIKSNKHQIGFNFFWILMICGTLFSRISSNSIMNGTNFISQVFYAGAVLISLIGFIWIYSKKHFKISPELIFIASWIFFMLLAGRAAQRMFFAITPLVCFMAGYLIVKFIGYSKNVKDEIVKPIMIILLILSVVGGVYSVNQSYQGISYQSQYTGPSANSQWQGAMSWARNNTNEWDTFVHWWDYGYWVQYLGERRTLTDGGHANGFWDHQVGRYLLTNTYPESAMSFMKSHNVSYILIDPTELGKYGAYSKIGSDDSGKDRYSEIPVMIGDSSQTKENSNGTTYVYPGGYGLDEDIVYEKEGHQILLPAWKAANIGIILETEKEGESMTFKQPEGVYYYNGAQYRIPLRYVYYSGELLDFKTGLDAVIRVLPSVEGGRINSMGSIIYLSPKVSKSLFARLYLLNDAFNQYETVKVAHSEDCEVVKMLSMQGINVGDMVYYQGVQGPIKIWKVDYPEDILDREEFMQKKGAYASLDNLEVKK